MSIVPFRDQYAYFLKAPYNSQLVDEYLNGTDSIARFLIDQEYNSFISSHHPLVHFLPMAREDLLHSNALYKKFNTLKNFKQIWKRHPYVNSLLKAKVTSNKQFIASIFEHLEQDQLLLKQQFNLNRLKVANLEINKGDVHQNGKTTAIITFENDVKIVYKPRTAGLDIAFGELLHSFNKFHKKLPLKVIKFIDRGKYSWCEFVTDDSCNSIKEIKEYYQKTGVLLALMYVLKGVDLHFENIIAHGKDPVIIDLECLFHNSNVDYFNILHTGMCPVLSLNGFENSAVDLSGMGASGAIKLDKKEWKWMHLETDALNLERTPGYVRARGNMPVYKGKIISSGKYEKQVLQGFDLVYSWIQTIQKQIEAGESHAFEVFQDQVFRIIPRITQDYTDILYNSFSPLAVQSVSSRKESIHKDLINFNLSLPFLTTTENKKVLKAELAAIERMDIPHFTGNTTDHHIKESGKVILKNHFKQTPYEAIIAHIMRFDQKEATTQKNLIQSSLASRYHLDISKKSKQVKTTKKFKSDDYNQQLEAIASHIKNTSIVSYGEINWSTFIEENGTLVFSLLDNTLYSGKLGIAIFLSNLSKHHKTDNYQATIDAILKDAIAHFKNAKEEVNISFTSGISGLIHTLIEINTEQYRDTLLELSGYITTAVIEKDEVLDYIGGAAGCLTVLCSLYKATKSERVLSQCLELGHHLLHKSVIDPVSLHRCWTSSLIGVPLTGYSHGAAGIGLALLKLFEITRLEIFNEAYYDAIKFENYYYDVSQKNWKDLRNNQSNFQNSWCHGASGIGLARVEAYRISKDKSLLADIRNAVNGTIKKKTTNLDHYCCGNAGRLHFLMEASTVIKHKALKQNIQDQVKEMLHKKGTNGYFLTQSNPNVSAENPSLYRGTSGIGQMLIRYDEFLVTNHLK